MDWSLYWTPMVCHWERYCDWNASIAACGTILISTVTAHLLVSCLFFLFFFFWLGNFLCLTSRQFYQLLYVPVVSTLFLSLIPWLMRYVGAGVLRIIIMVLDSQIELVHAKEIRRCTLLATHVSHWAILYRLCIQLVTTTMSSLYYIFCFLYWANRQNNEGWGTNRSPVILYNWWKKEHLTRHVTDGPLC